MAQNPYLESALSLARMGYPVLPLKPGEKRPHPRLVPQGLKEATLEADRIRAWWEEDPASGLGLLPPPGVLVLDADSGEALGDLLSTFSLAHAPRVRTPRGGGHIYLRLPPGKTFPATPGLLPGLDLRGMGRAYLVAPPTLVRGARYRFEVPLLPPGDLPPVPTRLLRLLEEKSARSGAHRVGEAPQVYPMRTTSVPQNRLTALLESYARRVAEAPVGTRHATLLRYSLAAGGLIPYGLPEALARQRLLEASLQAGLPYGEALATLRWGLEKGAASPIPLTDRPRPPGVGRAKVQP